MGVKAARERRTEEWKEERKNRERISRKIERPSSEHSSELVKARACRWCQGEYSGSKKPINIKLMLIQGQD